MATDSVYVAWSLVPCLGRHNWIFTALFRETHVCAKAPQWLFQPEVMQANWSLSVVDIKLWCYEVYDLWSFVEWFCLKKWCIFLYFFGWCHISWPGDTHLANQPLPQRIDHVVLWLRAIKVPKQIQKKRTSYLKSIASRALGTLKQCWNVCWI